MDNTTVFPLVINGTNLVPSSFNNTYRYTPPSGAFTFPKHTRIGVGKISLFYSWYNFRDDYNNNSFSISFSGYGILNINIGNQTLSVPDLNSYVQQQMIQAGLYLVNSSGENVYYFEILENAAAYSIQVNVFPVPSVLPVGWTNGGSLPLSGFCPQLIVPSTNFQNSIGYAAGSYPTSAIETTTQSFLSTSTPQLSPIQSIQMTCSLLRNYYNNNPKVLYSFTSAGTTFGSLIDTAPNYAQFTTVLPGFYSFIEVSFIDQDGNPVPINDTNLTVLLLIQVPNED